MSEKQFDKVPNIGVQDDPHILKQPKAVWAVFFSCIIAFMGLGLVDPILPTISEQLNASTSEASLLFTSYNTVMALAMLITGSITSRIGMKKTLLSGIILIMAFSALGGASGGVWSVIGFRGGWGLGNALFVATALTAIVSLSNSKSGKAVILYEAAIGLGISVGPLLGGLLGAVSWRGPFFGVAVLMVIAFIFLMSVMPDTRSAKENSKPVKKTSIADPFRALKHRPLLVFGITAAFYNYGFFTVLAYTPFALELDEHGIGFVFLGWGILLALTSVFMAPKMEQHLGTVKSMCVMLSLFAILLLIMGIFASTQWVLIACAILAGGTLGNNNTLITTAVMNASNAEKSTASAAYSFLRFIGAALAPYLSGKLSELFNSHVPFVVGALFVLVSVFVLILNHKHIRHVDTAE